MLRLNYYAGVECIGVLLSAGADRELRDADGKTAKQAATEAGRDDCTRALSVEIGGTNVRLSTLLRCSTGGLSCIASGFNPFRAIMSWQSSFVHSRLPLSSIIS